MSRKSGYTSSLQENRVQGARKYPERAGIQAWGARCGVGFNLDGICIRGNDYYIKLQYLRSRWYSTDQGRFISRDTWQGDYNRPASLNRWNYGYANPIRFTDPSGFDPLNSEWLRVFQKRHDRLPKFEDIVIRLFEITYPTEWRFGEFYNDDGSLNEQNYRKILRKNVPASRSWVDFPHALTRLAAKYDTDERDIFVRDVGTLYAGLPTRFEANVASALWNSKSGGAKVIVLNNAGIPLEWIGEDGDGNVHHWAGSFVFGYYNGIYDWTFDNGN